MEKKCCHNLGSKVKAVSTKISHQTYFSSFFFHPLVYSTLSYLQEHAPDSSNLVNVCDGNDGLSAKHVNQMSESAVPLVLSRITVAMTCHT